MTTKDPSIVDQAGAWSSRSDDAITTWASTLDRPHPLPAPLAPTPLIGRESDLGMVRHSLLEETRLLTLTGAGGIGKTRLALALAADLAAAFADGVRFLDLSSLRDPALVVPTITRALGAPVEGRSPALDGLCAYLRERHMLLVLDNLEQVLPAGADLAAILAACPSLAILATSREPLRLRWEQTMPLAPLALPGPMHSPDLTALATIPAVALFVLRARAVRPDFALTERNATAVAAICTRLDGLPLALELAAAWIAVLSPEALLARLEPRLPLLRWEVADVPARQRTLRATIDWSFDLLTPAEQALFQRLAVFAGGWSLEAAAAVTLNDPGANGIDTLQGVAALVAKGLVQPVGDVDGMPGFRLLETIREYAAERLAASADTHLVRGPHAAWYLDLAESGWRNWYGPQQRAWQARLEREGDNLRAALAWAVAAGDVETEVRLCAALWQLWIRGHLAEGWRWMDGALSRAERVGPALRAQLYNGAASVALPLGQGARAAELYRAALELREALGDAVGVAYALNNLGMVATEQGDLLAAERLLTESLACFRALGQAHGAAFALDNLARVLMYQGQGARASDLHEEALALWRSIGNTQGVAEALSGLGRLSRGGDDELAVARYAESLVVVQELGTERRLVAEILEGLGLVAARLRQERLAARLWGMAAGLRERIGAPLAPIDRSAHDDLVAAVRERLGAEPFMAAWATGQATPPQDVGAVAQAAVTELSCAEPRGSGASAALLSPREVEVLHLMAAGLSNRAIGARLFVTERTAKFHVTAIFQKLGAENRTHAVALARQRSLL